VRFLQHILGALLGIALFTAAFVFASIFIAFAGVAVLVIWVWLWWRTRRLRREIDERAGALHGREGEVIEGEYRVEGEERRETRRIKRRED